MQAKFRGANFMVRKRPKVPVDQRIREWALAVGDEVGGVVAVAVAVAAIATARVRERLGCSPPSGHSNRSKWSAAPRTSGSGARWWAW